MIEHVIPKRYNPSHSEKLKYNLSEGQNGLLINEFIKKLLDSPKESRLVIAIPNKIGGLWFPDEAVSMLRRTSDEKDLELVSGYYDESFIITPENIDYTRLHQILDNDAKVIAYTKQYGKRKVIDVVPFSVKRTDDQNYEYIAIIVKP